MELDASQINYDNEENDKKEVGFVKVEQNNVRRKLFQEDGTENNEQYQDFGTVAICEQDNLMSQKNWNRESKDENKNENKSYVKEEGAVVLLISFCKDVQIMNLIEERAKVLGAEIEVSHCFPESSFRICSLRTYSLIFLDLNGDVIENFFRVSLAIRSSTLSNHNTPIIGFKHADTIKDDRWKNYGITEIIYGPLYHSAIDGALGKFICQTVKREPQVADDKVSRNLAFIASASGRKDEKRPPSYQKTTSQSLDVNFSKHPWAPNRSNASPIPACDSTDQITSFCESENSEATIRQVEGQQGYVDDKTTSPQICTTYLTTGQSSLPTYSTHCQMQLVSSNANRQIQSEVVLPNANSGAVTNLDANASKQNPSGWNVIQQILDLHQNVQKDVDSKLKAGAQSGNNTAPMTKTPTSQPSVTPSATVYPSTCQHQQRSYEANSAFTTTVVIPQNTSYIVNGTPGSSNMRISVVPDDYAKHSSKERERRERIKESCDELRKLLPKQLMAGRRQDMATVLELTVYYLKVVQEHLPTIIQQQLYQKFLNYQDAKSRRKRKGAEMTPYMAQSKYQRHATGTATATATAVTNGYHLANYTNATYSPQAMQSNNHQPMTNTGYFSSIYHPLITSPYYATMNPNATQTIYGSASHLPVPIMDHAMHLRSQYYNETMPTQSGLPCYLAVTSSSRDPSNCNLTR